LLSCCHSTGGDDNFLSSFGIHSSFGEISFPGNPRQRGRDNSGTRGKSIVLGWHCGGEKSMSSTEEGEKLLTGQTYMHYFRFVKTKKRIIIFSPHFCNPYTKCHGIVRQGAL
jgi:hypothetical protein